MDESRTTFTCALIAAISICSAYILSQKPDHPHLTTINRIVYHTEDRQVTLSRSADATSWEAAYFRSTPTKDHEVYFKTSDRIISLITRAADLPISNSKLIVNQEDLRKYQINELDHWLRIETTTGKSWHFLIGSSPYLSSDHYALLRSTKRLHILPGSFLSDLLHSPTLYADKVLSEQ